MGKIDYRNLEVAECRSLQKEMEDMVNVLHEPAAIASFLSQFMTMSELVMLGRRIQIAKRLLGGDSQFSICKALHVGLPTVQRVDRWLRSGVKDYKKIFSEQYDCWKEAKKEKRDYHFPHSFTALRRKLPLHFLIFNLLLDER